MWEALLLCSSTNIDRLIKPKEDEVDEQTWESWWTDMGKLRNTYRMLGTNRRGLDVEGILILT